MPAKPQSGRAIELGLALRIVSKRGRQVMFGQTGLLFANRQWVKETTDEVITLPIAFSKIKFVVLGTCTTSAWVYENVSVLNDSDLSTVTAWSASENQAGRIIKPKNIIAMGI